MSPVAAHSVTHILDRLGLDNQMGQLVDMADLVTDADLQDLSPRPSVAAASQKTASSLLSEMAGEFSCRLQHCSSILRWLLEAASGLEQSLGRLQA